MPDVNLAYQTVFKLVGKQGQRVLEKKEFLDSVAKIDKDLAKTIEKSVEGVTKPTFELSGKATANYNIAGLKIKNGNNEVIGTGAVSKAQDDFYDNTVTLKGRFDLPNGEKIRIDGGHDEYDEIFNVYTGKNRTLLRECSYRDAGYTNVLQPVRKFDKDGIIGEYRVFNAKKNKMETVYKYGDTVLGDMKITEGKNGIKKLEMKANTPYSEPQVEFYDNKGNIVASSMFNNNCGKRKIETIYDKGRSVFTKTTYFEDGKPCRFAYAYQKSGTRGIVTEIDEKTGKEVVSGLISEDGCDILLSIRELHQLNSNEDVRKTIEELSIHFDKYTTNLMK